MLKSLNDPEELIVHGFSLGFLTGLKGLEDMKHAFLEDGLGYKECILSLLGLGLVLRV